MRLSEANTVGSETGDHLKRQGPPAAYAILRPILAQRTRFPVLTRIGIALCRSAASPTVVDPLLDVIAEHQTMGGWVVIGGALQERLATDPVGALAACRRFVEMADVWFGADILGERVPGPALQHDLPLFLERLSPWRTDPCRWVRRALGVAVHVWAKRSRGEAALVEEAKILLTFLEPLFGERDVDAVKGIGWGLKTMGRHYPDQVAPWIAKQLARPPKPRRVMVRKSLTYLSDEKRRMVEAAQ